MTAGGLQPFAIEANLRSLRVRYPDSTFLRTFINDSSRRSRDAFVRLWLTEGEPFAFRDCPAIFEELRGWLGARLEINPKQITLLGSARIGYSMAPMPKYGAPFSSESDLDLAIVSSNLLQRISEEFSAFESDYSNKCITPRNDRERAYWDENIGVGRRSLRAGFFDVNKIPYLHRYSVAQNIGHTMWLICRKLSVTSDAPGAKRASLRIYRDWDALIDRVSNNLRWALKVGSMSD